MQRFVDIQKSSIPFHCSTTNAVCLHILKIPRRTSRKRRFQIKMVTSPPLRRWSSKWYQLDSPLTPRHRHTSLTHERTHCTHKQKHTHIFLRTDTPHPITSDSLSHSHLKPEGPLYFIYLFCIFAFINPSITLCLLCREELWNHMSSRRW